MKRGEESGQDSAVMRLALIGLAFALISGCALFEDERTSQGRKLYNHYCSHCHGASGQQAEGFNWEHMPDPRPKNLASKAEMSTFSDEEIFHTVYRDMKDTSDPKVLDDDDYFAVSTMPTFKYTLSEEEIWAIVGYVRTLHGMSLSYEVEERRKELEKAFQEAKVEMEQANATFEAAEAKAAEAQAAKEELLTDEELEDYEPEEVVLPEEEVFLAENKKYELAKADFENFSMRPKQKQISRPDLSIEEEERDRQAKVGEKLYRNKYGCHGCHSINGDGGIVGPELDRAGFRLNSPWIYRWILYPQAMKKHTRMPNLGITDKDGRALTYYLGTLQAPMPEKEGSGI
jgi:mono/diheme cytochrome c family protein